MTGSPREHRMCPEFTDLFPDVMGYLPLIGAGDSESVSVKSVMLPKRTPRTAHNKKKNQRK